MRTHALVEQRGRDLRSVRPLEATLGVVPQDWDDPLHVMAVRRRDIDRQRDAIIVDRDMDLDAMDLLAAINVALEAAWR